MNTQNCTAVAYLRVAALSPHSQPALIRQMDSCELYAQSTGLRISRLYVDVGQSGNRSDRPALTSLLREVWPRRIKRVIVADATRLARSRELERSLLRVLARRGAVVSVADPQLHRLDS
jgi:DNA invertase Pin-like site-specific DNA recombinase